jgi:hypothetical protein
MVNDINIVDFSDGWERIDNPEAVRYYKQVQSTKTTKKAENAWYRKSIGPFAITIRESFKLALAKANIRTDYVMFDSSGYIVVPKSALH